MTFALWKRILRTPHGAALGLCILLDGILMAVSAPILPVMLANHLGLDKTGVAAFFLLLTLTVIVITPATGYLSDGTIARYKLVLVGGTGGAAASLILATGMLPVHAFIACPLLVGTGLLFPQMFAVAHDGVLADWERDAQVMGITALRTLYSFGYIVGTALGGWLVGIMAVQAIFYLLAAAGFALTLFGALVLYRIEAHITRQATRQSEEAVPTPKTYVTLPLYTLLAPLLALVILQGADSTRQVYLSLIMFQVFKDASIAPLMFGITAAFELITMELLGYFASKRGERLVIAASALVGALYYIVMAFTPMLAVMYLAQALYAIFVAALVGVAMAYVQNLLAERAGLGGSLYVAVMNTGSLVGILAPLLVTGYDQKIFIIPAVLCVVGAVLMMVGASSTSSRSK